MEDTEIINEILQNRNIDDIFDFLNPTDDFLVDDKEFCYIEKAAKIICNALESHKQFGVLFDVDQDGISSGAIATRWLKHNGATVTTYINEGKAHGLSTFDMSRLDNNKVDVLWIVDSIETSTEYYQNILSKGIQIVITDHHLVTDDVQKLVGSNDNIALVSSALNYSNPELSGAGVTWKMCRYLDWIFLDDFSDDLIDLAATGIVADMCSVGADAMENRFICAEGFSNVQNTAIKKINGRYDFDAKSVSFGIAPLTNAAMRTNNNQTAMDLFLSDDANESRLLIKQLKKCKENQNTEVLYLMPSLEQEAEKQLDQKCMFFLVNTESDISGLLANRLLEEYKRPVFVLKTRLNIDEKTGEVKNIEYAGSCRAVGVENFKHFVEQTGLGWSGGHPNAFGFGVDQIDYEYFKELILEQLQDIEFEEELTIDAEIEIGQVNSDLIYRINRLDEISGKGFPSINVMIPNLTDYQIQFMSNRKHLKLVTPDMIFIKWNYNGDASEFDGPLDVVGSLDNSNFGGSFCKQMILTDWRKSSE